MSRPNRPLLAIALSSFALLAMACGDGTTSTSEGAVDSAGTSTGGAAETVVTTGAGGNELPFDLQRCDPEARLQEADPAFYRDEPLYVGNEQPIEQVADWASTKPGFEDLWIDRDHNGWIGVGFSHDAAARQPELEAEFPDVGVVAVEVSATEADLQSLRDEVEAALDGLSSWGLGHTVARAMVEVSVPVLDEETLSRLAPLAGPTLCVDGTDPVDAVSDGPQPSDGEGWRLLATDRTGAAYRTGVATTAEQYANLWDEAGLVGDRPEVAFESEIVIWFGAVYGSGCPIRLDDVTVDLDRQILHGDFVQPGNPTACNDDANPEAYVVAVGRDRLPEAPFAVQLDADDPPAGAPEERTTVQVDLRPAGATASEADLVVESLDEASPPRPDQLEPGLVIEPDVPWIVLIDLACSVDVVGPLNGTMWRAVDPDLSAGPPQVWTHDANDGFVEGELLLTTDPAKLTATVNGVEVGYEPVPAGEQVMRVCR